MVWVGLEVAAASALQDEMFVIIFRFAFYTRLRLNFSALNMTF